MTKEESSSHCDMFIIHAFTTHSRKTTTSFSSYLSAVIQITIIPTQLSLSISPMLYSKSSWISWKTWFTCQKLANYIPWLFPISSIFLGSVADLINQGLYYHDRIRSSELAAALWELVLLRVANEYKSAHSCMLLVFVVKIEATSDVVFDCITIV